MTCRSGTKRYKEQLACLRGSLSSDFVFYNIWTDYHESFSVEKIKFFPSSCNNGLLQQYATQQVIYSCSFSRAICFVIQSEKAKLNLTKLILITQKDCADVPVFLVFYRCQQNIKETQDQYGCDLLDRWLNSYYTGHKSTAEVPLQFRC